MNDSKNSDLAIVLFRRDLRLADHPALRAGARHGSLLPVYVLEDDDPHGASGAAGWWLEASLAALAESLGKRGSQLHITRGELVKVVETLSRATGARAVYWNRRYDPFGEATDARLKSRLRESGLTAESFNGALLREPWEVMTKTKTPFSVFTAFARASMALPPPPLPEAAPKLPPPPTLRGAQAGLSLAELRLSPPIPREKPWQAGLREAWSPGEQTAKTLLDTFIKNAMSDYHRDRDIPSVVGTSRLSPHLVFGEISPRQAWHTVQRALDGRKPKDGSGPATFLKQLIWREFAHHLLHYRPEIIDTPLNERFAHFAWEDRKDWLTAWQRGKTGYPIVDAGMRELWATGWMHNRVRMVVASFLVKHLLTPWQHGAAWFWDTLVDADLANNSQNWQWAAGTGVDAAPYFRIFNPMLQGARFDPDGHYVRRWVPEIAGLPNKYIHAPWDAPAKVAEAAGVVLGKTYPKPIVEHGAARAAALVRYERMRRESASPKTTKAAKG